MIYFKSYGRMRSRYHAYIHGFSLIELSIVLVILGLLVGSVLTGQSMVHAAELRAVVKEYEAYRIADRTFKDKYFNLPGDITNATSLWGKDNSACSADTGSAATPGTCNGNGDGTINWATSAGTTGEMFRYWQQLALAGLISGSYTGLAGSGGGAHAVVGQNIPASKLNNAGWSVYSFPTVAINGSGWPNFEGTYGNQYILGIQTSSGPSEGYALKPEDAWNIDNKLDDAKPGTGGVRVYEAYTNCHDAGTSTTVALASTANYKLSYTTAACALLFNLP